MGLVPQVFFVGNAQAAPQFELAFVRLDRMKKSVGGGSPVPQHTGGTVCAKPVVASTEAHVEVRFPTTIGGTGVFPDFVVGTDVNDWTTSVTNMPFVAGVQATAWPSLGAVATSVTGKTVRWTSGDLTVGTVYCFNFAAGTAGNETLVNSDEGYQFDTAVQARVTTLDGVGPTAIEETNWNPAIIDDDQIVITAIVPPLLQMEFLTGNVDTFGNLDPGTVEVTAGVPVQIKTNAKSGWIMWVRDQYQGMYSSTANSTIPTPANVAGVETIVAGTPGYVLDVDINGGDTLDDGDPLCDADPVGNGTLTIDAEYDGTAAGEGGYLANFYREVASCEGTVLPNTTDGDIVEFFGKATIAFSTPAATDYTDTITVVAAGTF
jgi:hypothetical protein